MNKYEVIYADPPWAQKRGGKKNSRPLSSGMDLEYPTMSLGAINCVLFRAMECAHQNHVLFLWTIEKFLYESETIARMLGYKVHSRMIWNKVVGIPAAFTIRFGHEYLLYCYHGKLLGVDRCQRGKIHSVFTEKPKRHSQKPEVAYKIIEALYPSQTKIELFARNTRLGWDSWGNEVGVVDDIEPLLTTQPKQMHFKCTSSVNTQ